MSEQPEVTTWLARFRELHSIAQAGLGYTENPFDRIRYARLAELSAELLADLDTEAPEGARVALVGSVVAEIGYLTPKVDVRAAVFDERGRVLLVRERSDGRWSLPGGWADVNETLATAAVREVLEESGYVVELDRLLGVYDREKWGHPPFTWFTVKVVVAARLVGGAAAPSVETDGADFFAADALPTLSVGRTSAELLRRVFEHHADPHLPADLD